MDDFISVYAKATGVKHRVPAHFMTVPSIAKHFTKTPRQRRREAEKRPARRRRTSPVAIPSNTETPIAGEKEN
jgi:hypothetical protein